LVGLACDVDVRVAELSTGQKQLVALARAIVREPAIVVADEPLTYLDDSGREVLTEVLSHASARGTAAVVATNDHRLLRAGAHHGWRHCELRDGSLRVVADRRIMPDSVDETPDDDYESIEISVEDNVVPFPLVAQAGGME
jgi:ABC-type ATPase involved in cell division